MVEMFPPPARERPEKFGTWQNPFTMGKALPPEQGPNLMGLLPRGRLAKRGTSFLGKLFAALAMEYMRLGLEADRFVREQDPRTTDVLIEEWEDFVGIPDECLPAPAGTLQERRAAVVAKLTDRGGCSKQFFLEVAEELGYSIQIEEYEAMTAGFRAGARTQDHTWRFVWRVKGLGNTIKFFKCGANKSGDKLRIYTGGTELVCLFTLLKPAHTYVMFLDDP